MVDSMPASATAHRPELAGRSFQAMGVSLVIHPRNPYAPTSHANVRFFIAEKLGADPVWWFGGGYDLTPYYGNQDDCRHWHATAKAACDPFGDDLHPRLKAWCDEYFYLPHRKEARGIGGIFFDYKMDNWGKNFLFVKDVGITFASIANKIIKKKMFTKWTKKEKKIQLLKRGRYVEFNLLYDRGTKFGLNSGGNTEAILMSLPPAAKWN